MARSCRKDRTVRMVSRMCTVRVLWLVRMVLRAPSVLTARMVRRVRIVSRVRSGRMVVGFVRSVGVVWSVWPIGL